MENSICYTVKRMITMHILPNIWPMKLGQSIEYDIRNIFLEKSYTKCSEETNPFISKNWGSTVWNFIQFIFLYVQVEDYQNILNPRCLQYVFITHKSFLKNKKRAGTSFPASFSVRFLRKNVFHTIFY